MHLLAIAGGERHYDPWPSFAKAHYNPASFVLVSGSERVGKSISAAAEAFAWIPLSELIWIAGPHYLNALKEFDYLLEACRRAKMRVRGVKRSDKGVSSFLVRDTVRDIDVRVETRSLYDIEASVVSEAPDLILVVEAGLVPRDPTEKLRLRLSTKRGRCWLSGTLEDASPWFQHAYKIWQDWPNDDLGFAISVPLYENVQDFPGGAENPEILTLKRTLRPSTYSHRVEGKPAPSESLVFKKTFTRGNDPYCARPMRFIPLDENRNLKPVEIAIDPGHRPSYYTVHFIQMQGDEVCVIDEVAMVGAYHEEVIRAAMQRPAWENVIGGTIDPWAAKQHGLGYSQSPWDIWLAESGIALRLPEPAPTPLQIIDRYWYFLRNTHGPKFFYDPAACPRYDEEWKHWKYAKDEEGRPLKTEPEKRLCDGVKGVGYYLVDRYGVGLFSKSRVRRKARTSQWRLR